MRKLSIYIKSIHPSNKQTFEMIPFLLQIFLQKSISQALSRTQRSASNVKIKLSLIHRQQQQEITWREIAQFNSQCQQLIFLATVM